MVKTQVENVRKTFDNGAVVGVDDVNFTVEEGELVVLVGPSGCGKSTTLRCIAGLEKPDSGRILFDDEDVTGLQAKDRDVSMVFQNYALYPSMTAYGNMAFGLKMRGFEHHEINQRVREAAELMGIENLLDRHPQQLSGGQMQRIALGRAIVRDPNLFLLDEPLSNLDAKLRSKMRTEIQRLQKDLGVATIFVTHDQAEAMTIGDRIAVMNAGRIEQIGTPEEIYNDPETLFVADFVGEPGINFFELSYDGSALSNGSFAIELPDEIVEAIESDGAGSDVVVAVRPEDVLLNESDAGLFETEAEVTEFLGDDIIVYFTLDGERHRSVVSGDRRVRPGDSLVIDFDLPSVHLFRPDGSKIAKWMRATGDVADAE